MAGILFPTGNKSQKHVFIIFFRRSKNIRKIIRNAQYVPSFDAEPSPATKHTKGSKKFLMMESYLPGVARSHRKPCSTPVFPLCLRSKGSIYKRNAILRNHSVDRLGNKGAAPICYIRIAGIHYNDHFPASSFGNQIIQNIMDFSLPNPTAFILPASML